MTPYTKIQRKKVYNNEMMLQKECCLFISNQKYSSEFNNKIIVFGLPLDATNTEIKEIFQKFGLITDIYIPIPKLTYETKYAFVTFQESNTALQAIPPNLGLQLRDFPLTVKLYRSKVG